MSRPPHCTLVSLREVVAPVDDVEDEKHDRRQRPGDLLQNFSLLDAGPPSTVCPAHLLVMDVGQSYVMVNGVGARTERR